MMSSKKEKRAIIAAMDYLGGKTAQAIYYIIPNNAMIMQAFMGRENGKWTIYFFMYMTRHKKEKAIPESQFSKFNISKEMMDDSREIINDALAYVERQIPPGTINSFTLTMDSAGRYRYGWSDRKLEKKNFKSGVKAEYAGILASSPDYSTGYRENVATFESGDDYISENALTAEQMLKDFGNNW